MAIRGKVRDIKAQTGRTVSGTVVDTSTKTEYPYLQPFGLELGLVVNGVVTFETITTPDGTTTAVALDPLEKGTIEQIDSTTGTGTILDKAGNKIEFEQCYSSELKLAQNSPVKFSPVWVDGKLKATSVRLAGNN